MKERLFWIVLVIGLSLYFTKCRQVKCPELVGVRLDTSSIKQIDSSTAHIPKISGHGNNIDSYNDKVRFYLDSFVEYVPVQNKVTKIYEYPKIDTLAVVQAYFGTNYYSDTNKLKYATFIVTDTVTQNKIKGRGVQPIWDIPIVTRTETYMQPKKSEIYGGLKFGYNNVGADLMFKDTLNRIWEFNVQYIGKFYYSLGRKWQLK